MSKGVVVEKFPETLVIEDPLGPHTLSLCDPSKPTYDDGRVFADVFEPNAKAKVTELRRRYNAHVALVKALEGTVRAMGLHGPCEQNSCRDCAAAYKQARAAIAAATEPAP